ncbi:hypothetical protein MLD38_027410 [Melastoma candidum]|uniref:Uncharacterized protein n=1 Tax=Melastoma candidum TaxID=119954 RepID=A0ACB9P4E8_9MYRT|nr:hypothetical protein MLD38_027410 [Melastoma candidum]
MGCGVRGVILDADVILTPISSSPPQGPDDAVRLPPLADRLLRRLSLSGIRTGIALRSDSPSRVVELLMNLAASHSMECFGLNSWSAEDIICEIQKSWGEGGGEIIYVASESSKRMMIELASHGWVVVDLVSEMTDSNKSGSSNLISINSLLQLPSIICGIIKKTTSLDILVVGYIMKPSREEDFAKRGAFPMHPTPNGLIFMPLSFELPLHSQLNEVDVVLHKATDEIVSLNLSTLSEVSVRVNYSKGMQEVKSYLEHHRQVCVIDPLDKVYPIVDRLEIQKLLSDLKDPDGEGKHKIRGPNFFQVDNFDDDVILTAKGKFPFPCIVKPQVACGVADAHSMGIAFEVDNLMGLRVPLPAIVQEYVDHFSTLYKFYVLGEKVFHAAKRSMPNGTTLRKLSESKGLKPLLFDSLKSLPTVTGVEIDLPGNGSIPKANSEVLDFDLVTRTAKWLSDRLSLTIFGFDVVVQEGTLDHVIVDINYLPSFKEVPDDIAVPAFWNAIRKKYDLSRTQEGSGAC